MFKRHFFMPHICMCIAGTLWVGGVKEQGDRVTGWQNVLQRGTHWQIVQASWTSTLCTHPGVHFQEQLAVENKQDQLKIRFYFFLQPAVFFAWVAKHSQWSPAVEGAGGRLTPPLLLCHQWVQGRAASGISHQFQAQHLDLDPGFHY